MKGKRLLLLFVTYLAILGHIQLAMKKNMLRAKETLGRALGGGEGAMVDGRLCYRLAG